MARQFRQRGLKGIDNVMRNLNKELRKMEVKSAAGMLEAAKYIRADMEKTPPLIPWDTGNLVNSWSVTSGRIPMKGPFVRMAFLALYAAAVHEMTKPDINWNRPGSGGKFFESALKRNDKVILAIIGGSMKF